MSNPRFELDEHIMFAGGISAERDYDTGSVLAKFEYSFIKKFERLGGDPERLYEALSKSIEYDRRGEPQVNRYRLVCFYWGHHPRQARIIPPIVRRGTGLLVIPPKTRF